MVNVITLLTSDDAISGMRTKNIFALAPQYIIIIALAQYSSGGLWAFSTDNNREYLG